MLYALPSEEIGLVGVINPASYAAGTQTTGWVSVKDFQTFMAILTVGALGTSATVDAKLEQATSSGGAGAKDVTGKSITQLTQAGSDSNKQVIIDLRHSHLDIKNDFSYVRLSVTVAVAASILGAVILGVHAQNTPVTSLDLSTVDEIK